MRDLLLIAGPTASGKSALATAAARRLDAEIVNADSMQIYAGLPVITAQPGEAERGGVAHHLFGEIDPAERFTTGRWAEAALRRIDEIHARGRRVVLVGGTGLYFKALTEGLAPAPDIPEDARARARALGQARGVDALAAEARRLDPDAAARIDANDRQRLLRVVELGYAGARLSALQAETAPLIAPDSWTGVVIEPEREALYARIDQRFASMVEAGALEEAAAIAARRLDPELPAMKAVGLPPLLAHLNGEITLDEALETGARDTRRYAKRQYTWFRNQTPDWFRVASLDPDAQREELEPVLSRIRPDPLQ